MKKLLLCLIILFTYLSSEAQLYKSENPFAHTFSIVAKDDKTGDMAVAVQSHWFSVGSTVSWGEAGVGVVATQSFVNKSFGMRGLALIKEGKTAQEALDILLESDEGRAVRQVAILDVNGNIATHTGKKCIQHAGHIQGENYSVQANMMLTDVVWKAMSKSFEANGELPLPERMVAALEAGQAAGGDIRGRQSAALLVVGKDKPKHAWDEPKINLRVDDSETPIQEIKRLLKVYRAYEHMNNGDLAVEKGNMKLAMDEYGAAQQMFPDNLEMQYWTAITLANQGDLAKAKPMLKKVFAADNNWRILTERLPEVGLLTVSEDQLKEILSL